MSRQHFDNQGGNGSLPCGLDILISNHYWFLLVQHDFQHDLKRTIFLLKNVIATHCNSLLLDAIQRYDF